MRISLWSRVLGLAVSLGLGSAALARAGDLAASQKGSTLKVKGDDLGASVAFTSAEPNQPAVDGVVRVVPDPGTTVNGVEAVAVFTGVTQISVVLGDGTNQVTFDQLEIGGGVTVKGGVMPQVITVTGSQLGGNLVVNSVKGTLGFVCDGSQIAGKLNVKSAGTADDASLACEVDGGAQVNLGHGANDFAVGAGSYSSLALKSGFGVDHVTIDAASIGSSLKLALGAGVNHAAFVGTVVGDNFSYAGGGGGDFVTAQSLQVGLNASFKLGSGGNSLSLVDSLIGENLTVVGGSGNDAVTFGGTTSVGGKTKFSLGGGTNTSP